MSKGECQPENQGQCEPKTQPARATIGRCNSKRNDNVITIDGGKIDVVIIDAPETSNQGSRHLDASSNLKKMCSSNNIISIDDEGDDENDGFIGAYQNATSSKTFHLSSTAESDDECQLLSGQEEAYSKSPKGMFDVHSSECSTSESDMFESEMSEMSESDIFVTTDSDGDSDCEIMNDSTVNFREEWEKAALKKKMERSHALTKEGTCAFQSHHEPGVSMSETGQKKDGFPSTNNGTQTVANSETEKAHLDATMSAIGKGDPPLDGFTEESWLNCRKKHSAHDLDHAVEDMHQRQSSQKNNESLSNNLHRAQQRLEPFDHEMNSDCGQDAQAPKSFPCNSQMPRDPHGQSEKAFPMHKEGVNKGAALFTDGMLDMQQDEDVLRHGSSYSCTNDCPSQHMPDSKSRKVEYASEGISSFHRQHERASFEQDACPAEMHTDLYAVCSFGGEEEAVSGGSLQNLAQEDIEQSTLQNVSMTSDVQKNIIGEWEKHKNVKENRLAEEEEWASKRQQLQIQTEAMQRLQKRKKAETLRLLEMEKRQKQRLEEMRESQKQEEESINLKDQLRAEIRKKLEKLEMKYRDMASLLRGLGVNVGGGLYPLPHEVNVAYRQALLRFHPDRASRTDIRQQVEAEEKFKLISRLKEKLLPVAYY